MEVKLREELSDDFKWDLSHIYKNQKEFEKDIKSVESIIDKLVKINNSKVDLGDPKIFKKCSDLMTEVNKKMGRLYVYSNCKLDEDQSKEDSDILIQRLIDLSSMINVETSFLIEALKNFDNKTIEILLNDDSLKDYHFSIREMIRNKQYILSKSEEELLSKMMDSFSTSEEIYSIFTNTEMPHGSINLENGEEVEVNSVTFKELKQSNSREIRKSAYDCYWSNYDNYKGVFSKLIYKSIKSLATINQIRGYDSSLHSALNSDNIPVDVYHELVKNVNSNLDKLYDYLNFRKNILGYDKLHYYDLFNSITDEQTQTVTYEDAKDLTIKATEVLGVEYSDIVKEAFENRWVDVYPNKYKESGAYMRDSSSNEHPYILMNYDNRYDSALTLTHEMGHAVHSVLSNKYQPYTNTTYATYIAEIASTTNELLMLDYSLKNTNDKEFKISLINQYISNFRTTIYRQTMFAEFERFMYSEVENGKALTPSLLNSKYLELLEKYHGTSEGIAEIDEIYANEWSSIPHFYYDFYVYQYATSYIASVIIATKILNGDKEQLEKYLEMLKSGGSDYPIELLKKAGVDLMNPNSYKIAFDKFEEYLSMLKELLG